MTIADVITRPLTGDETLQPLQADGVTYPFGSRVPATNELLTIMPGVHWWRVPMWGPLKHVNGYVLDDVDGGVTVVDTGINSDEGVAAWKAMLAGPLADRPISRVACTHMHPDHVGLAGWLCRHHQAPLVMSRTEWLMVRMLMADRREETPPEMIAFWRAAGWNDDQVDAAKSDGWGRFAQIVSRLPLGFVRVKDGDRLPIGGSEWEVVTGAGHSPEHVCLLDRARGVFIAGDQVLPRISSNVSLTVSEPEADPLGEWLASIAKLKATVPDDVLVLPGHGEPFRGLHERLDALAAEHRERLDILAAHIAEPRRAVDCFAQLFRRPIDQATLGIASGEALANLRHLEVEGRATREIREGVWWYRQA